jgi:hypothetical protein
MKRILAATLLYCCAPTPALAGPLYAGVQLGDNSAGALLGFQIDQTYAIEAHYSKSSSSTTHAGLTVDTASTGIGIVGIAAFPMKLREALPYDVFLKAGYQRTNSTETYSIPTSVTLTLPYNGSFSTTKNQLILGCGAEYDFSKNLSGRMGLDFVGKDRNLNLGAIFKF